MMTPIPMLPPEMPPEMLAAMAKVCPGTTRMAGA